MMIQYNFYIVNTWTHFLHVSCAFIIFYLECLQPHRKHYFHGHQEMLGWHWMLNYLNKIKTHRQYVLCLLQQFQGHTRCYECPEYQVPSNYLPTFYRYNEQMLQQMTISRGLDTIPNCLVIINVFLECTWNKFFNCNKFIFIYFPEKALCLGKIFNNSGTSIRESCSKISGQ